MKNILIRLASILLFLITILTNLFAFAGLMTFPKEINVKLFILTLAVSIVNTLQVYFIFRKKNKYIS